MKTSRFSKEYDSRRDLTGWIWEKTRRLHFVALSLTWLSWVALGAIYGWGYCFLTDWHFQILEKRGFPNLPNSYVTFLIERVTGFKADDSLVVPLTGLIFAGVTIVTLIRWKRI